MINYYLLNTKFEIVTIIETYESLIWTDKYYEPGDFELYIPADKESLELYTTALKEHWYIIRDDDSPDDSRAMVVTKIESVTDYEGGNHLSITGKCLKSLLSRRVIWGKRVLSGDVEEEVRSLVKENAISPKLSERIIPNLELGDITGPIYDKDNTNIVNVSFDGEVLSTAIQQTLQLFYAGWDIRLDRRRKKFIFKVFKGTDRSTSQTSELEDRNPYVIFSVDFENLLSSTYDMDSTNYKNVAYVEASITQYTDDTTDASTNTETFDISQVAYPKKSDKLLASLNPVGLNRFELYVDGSSTATDDYTNYQNALRYLLVTQGQKELEDYKSEITITGKVIPDYTFAINKDYYIGDLVTIINEYGQKFDARVTQVTYTTDESSDTCVPTFSVESYDGMEEEDPKDYDESDMRISEDGSYRISENGEIRLRGSGYIYKERVASILVNGELTDISRLTEDSQSRDTVVEPTIYDTEE